MFELPEVITLAKQMDESLKGKVIQDGRLGNSPHKFVWYNRTHEEFNRLAQDKRVGCARPKGRWLLLPLEPGYILILGECGGKMLYHMPGAPVPKKHHLYLAFDDGSFFTVTTQMWGAMELYEAGKEQDREFIRGMRATPIEPDFTFEYFSGLIDEVTAEKKQSVKGLLTQDQTIPGLGNAIAQDIMFRARLHPRRPLNSLNDEQRCTLYEAILSTVHEIIEKGGRYDEFDLYGRPGQYVRLMDKNATGNPCPECGTTIEKMSYLGGTCYFCPACQRI